MLSVILLAILGVVAVTAFVLWRRYPIHLIIRSKHHLESIFDSIPDPITIIDSKFKTIRVNRAYAARTGKCFQEILGSTCHTLFPGQNEVCEQCLLEKAFQTGEPQFCPGRRVDAADGERHYDFFFFPLRDKINGTIVSVTEYIKDVTAETVAKRELERAKNSLEETYSQLQDEIELAREIQQSILPSRRTHMEGASIVGHYVPAEKVGGDLYDVIPLGNFRFGVFLGDVSGHGLPAAFVGAMTKMSLYNHSRTSLSPKVVLDKMNEDLNKNISTGHYLTGVYGVLDLNDNSFSYTRASHPFPLLVRENGEHENLDTAGIFIGMVEEADYGEAKVFLQPGDRLFFFTDGFYEYHTEDIAMLGHERFAQMLLESKSIPINEVSSFVDNSVRKFYNNSTFLDDDRTLVTIDITEKSRKERFRLLCEFDKEENIMVATFSDLAEAEGYISIILREMDRHGFQDDCIRRMKVVATELFANAIEHGNKSNPDKKLDIAVVVDTDKTKIACVDEGEGFKIEDIPDPTTEENVTKERGRGLHIIKSFADEVMQNEKGNRVTIVKLKKPPVPAPEPEPMM